MALGSSYVGATACQSCHQEQWQDWKGSDHDKAMQVATETSVLGQFKGQSVEIGKMSARFFRKDEGFWVETDGHDGKVRPYQVIYSFGHYPLQQYLVKGAKGRFQVLPFAWDSRSTDDGGQKWFHIYGQENILHNDRLHWTGALQNWNGMCADCHSTGLKRNYDAAQDSFNTTWQEINVACESCHGPRAAHVKQKTFAGKNTVDGVLDFIQSLSPNGEDAGWVREEGAYSPHWQGPVRVNKEIDGCAACHALRAPLSDGSEASGKFLDHFMPELITPPSYYIDGQIRGEDYVYGSFLQSRMHMKGVTCSDCHNPHSMKLKIKGNGLCTQCHSAELLDTPTHHQHEKGSEGAECVSCHMPQTTYMQVDPRRDHSFRIPRPDLSDKLGSPNACQNCHQDKSAIWAANAVKKWPQYVPSKPPHYGEIFQNVLDRKPGAIRQLRPLLEDDKIPEIIRASGYTMLGSFAPRAVESDITDGVTSVLPLIRLGAIRAAAILPANIRARVLGPLLSDELKAIRLEAARVLSADALSLRGGKWDQTCQKVVTELKQADEGTSWRGEGRVNLALLLSSGGDMTGAKEQYRKALDIDPYFFPSYVNLADILRSEGQDQRGMQVLEQGLNINPVDGDLNYAMAMAMIRSGDKHRALTYLATAVRSAKNNMRYAYVYSVALFELGKPDDALIVLKAAHHSSPGNGDILYMLITIHQKRREYAAALIYAQKLGLVYPENAQISRLVNNLTARAQSIK